MPGIAFAADSSSRKLSLLLLDLCRVTAYAMIAPANTTTTTAVAIRAQGVCFWLTIDLPGFVGGRFAGGLAAGRDATGLVALVGVLLGFAGGLRRVVGLASWHWTAKTGPV